VKPEEKGTMRDVLGPPRKDSVCFYWRMASGYSGWLSQEDVDYLIDYVLTYENIEVQLQPTIDKKGIWHGIRLKANKREIRSFAINETTVLTKNMNKEVDTFYYFKESLTRDKVLQAWSK
jgi:hypothetical protein